MTFALPFRLPSSRNAQLVCAAVGVMLTAVAISSFHRKPRAWPVGDVPIAFWSWRNLTPADADVRQAIDKAQARAIFLRAGQIDYQDGKLRRIRPVTGPLPKGIGLHLVYNATRALLSHLENVDENALADSIAAAFREDAGRAEQEHAQLLGLQIDIDVPTRLLGRYERILRALRARLKPGTQLSITGLPTWMQSFALPSTLAQVDFWIPQFYGAEIPERFDQPIPISSAQDVERFVDEARALNKPFYAGLAAYSCALLYNSNGALISLRGDLDPATIAADTDLELIDQRPFEMSGKPGSEWRYAYRARADGVTDGLVMHAGDQLVVDVPSAESLRLSARTVRELAGEKLLGICVFRIPARDDPATLTLAQVVAALSDSDSNPDIRIRFKPDERQADAWLLEIENQGSASAIGVLQIDVPVDAGAIASVVPQGGAWFAAICRTLDANNTPVYQPCGQSRANMIRVAAPGLKPGQTIRAMLVLKTTLSDVVPVSIKTQTDAGRPFLDRLEVIVAGGAKR